MLSIAKALTLFGAGVIFGLVTILGATTTALNQLRVGSESYRLIIDAKDLIADILPPPLYVIESYLEAKLATEQPATIGDRKARLAQLKQEFDTRRDVWRVSALPANLREGAERASVEADHFWTEVQSKLVPAIEAGKTGETTAALGRIDQAYKSHRTAVDELVAAATTFQTEVEASAERKNSLWNIALYLTSGVVLTLVMAGLFSMKRLVLAPLLAMTEAMRHLADGDRTTIVPARERSDEIGSMAKALQVFKDAAEEKRRLELRAESDRSAAELARRAMEVEREQVETRKTRDLLAMVEQVERETQGAVSTVVGLMDEMTGITRDMSATAQGLSQNSDTVARVARDAQAMMQAARVATDRLSASIDAVLKHVHTTHQVTASAVDASKNTGRSIENLSRVVHEISGVTQLITDIARQTSLLAINAGVEATRSGQDGRGFTIIALEVKSLSEQTSKATNRIIDLVKQVQTSTNGAVVAVSEISRTIQGVNEAAMEMSSAISQQVDMTREIAGNVSDTANASIELASRVEQVAQEAKATGQQAEQVDAVCSEVAGHARALHETLVRIVRTCSAEIDRRSKSRVPFDGMATLQVSGQTIVATLTNVSAGGANIQGRVGQIGDQIRLSVPGFDEILVAQIVDHSENATHIQFDGSNPAGSRLVAFVSHGGAERRAA